MAEYTYQSIPFPGSVFGQRCYRAGRTLIEETEIELAELVFDADEILWDWVMDGGELLAEMPKTLWHRDMSHLEYYLIKPGIFEFIWGMHHASLEADTDPYLRIWTDGYPWRLWKIQQHIPGFQRLIGPHANDNLEGHESFKEHPRLFFRTDYIKTATQLLVKDKLSSFLKNLAPSVHRTVKHQLERNPVDPSFKLPEFASVRGKSGFSRSNLLIDDYRDNVYRFVSSNRKGIYVKNQTPTVIFGFVPNTVWNEPKELLRYRSKFSATLEIAKAIRDLGYSSPPATRIAYPSPITERYDPIVFTLDIEGHMLRSEWIEPVRNLKKKLQL